MPVGVNHTLVVGLVATIDMGRHFFFDGIAYM
jgi:hypothetical protein